MSSNTRTHVSSRPVAGSNSLNFELLPLFVFFFDVFVEPFFVNLFMELCIRSLGAATDLVHLLHYCDRIEIRVLQVARSCIFDDNIIANDTLVSPYCRWPKTCEIGPKFSLRASWYFLQVDY